MPKSKKRNYTRKSEKRYTWVTFKTEIFEEEFTFPSPDHFSISMMSRLQKGEVEELIGWLSKAGVEEDALDAFSSLDALEMQSFMESWRDGEVSAPKS